MDPAIELLTKMVETPSISRDERAISDYLVRRFDEFGWVARQDAGGNAIGIKEQPDERGIVDREIVLLGHMDTVPGEIPVRLENGRLYGRGTVDAKGPLAAFVMATLAAELPAGTRVVVVGAVEEEISTSAGARRVAQEFQPDACLIGEPSGCHAVTLGYKGNLLLDYQLEQTCGHRAGPQVAVAERACEFWQRIRQHAEQFNESEARLFDQLLPSLNRMQTSSDGLSDAVRAELGLRLPMNFDVNEMMERVHAWSGQANVVTSGYVPAYSTKRNSPLVKAFGRTFARLGRQLTTKHKTGTSDMNVVGPAWKCPILAYGPGDSSLDHTPAEHIEIEEYLQAIDVLTSVLQGIDQYIVPRPATLLRGT